jgi:citrate/tricarballylate utilization protein
MQRMDVAFLILLLVTAVTGLVLLALRDQPVMGSLLTLHLGVVAGLFLTMPYGKFAHAVYRYAALVRNAVESEQD